MLISAMKMLIIMIVMLMTAMAMAMTRELGKEREIDRERQ